MDQKFDPKLKAAMQEIRDILLAYELGGSLLLVSETHSEFALGLPPWGSLEWDKDTQGQVGIRIKHQRATFDSEDAATAAAEGTAHFIAMVRKWGYKCGKDMDQLLTMLQEHWNIEETPQEPHYHDAEGERASHDPVNAVPRTKSLLEK